MTFVMTKYFLLESYKNNLCKISTKRDYKGKI